MSQKPRSIFGLISVFILVLALVTNAQDSATQKEPAGPKKLGEQKSPSNDAPPTVKIPSFEETKPVPEFVDLFNGKDLSGWVDVNTSPATWSVNNEGLLVCSGQPIGVMRSDRMYENFVLVIEWRHMQAGGNSGVFLWSDARPQGNRLPKGMEVQMLELEWPYLHAQKNGKPQPLAYVHGELFGAGPEKPYPERQAILMENGVAVWDVLQFCRREGSLDANIKAEVPNDFAGFFAAHPGIDRILLNGGKAAKSFGKYAAMHAPPSANQIAVPSTSPAYASMSFARKCELWRAAVLGLAS